MLKKSDFKKISKDLEAAALEILRKDANQAKGVKILEVKVESYPIGTGALEAGRQYNILIRAQTVYIEETPPK